MNTVVKKGLVVALAGAFAVSAQAAHHMSKKGYNCMVSKDKKVTHCAKVHKNKHGHVVHKTVTTVKK